MHDWPTFDNYGISATDVIWDYLKLQQKTIGTDVEENDILCLPERVKLSQNYPNPFNSSTVISYQLGTISQVELSIYNILGQKLATLVNKKQNSGTYKYEWDATGFPSGIYFYRLQVGTFSESKKVVFLK